MSLKTNIYSKKPREKAGPTSSSRFDYQKDWSLCKLLDSHKNLTDYVVIFDWHDDLVIMDSESDPSRIEFFQIKGLKSGNWTIKELLRRKKAADGTFLLSILGKLYDSKLKYEIETTSLNFVSNGRFSIDLEEENANAITKDSVCVIELSKQNRQQIRNQIKEEHNLPTDPEIENIMFLKVVDLSLDDSSGHSIGKVAEFLEYNFPDKKFNSPSVYRMLFDEVKRRANYNKDILNYDDLLNNKSICKRQFDEILNATGIKKDYDELWRRIEPELQLDHVSFQERKGIRQAWKKLELERMEPNNTYLFKLVQSIKDIIKEQEQTNTFNGLGLYTCVTTTIEIFYTKKVMPLSYERSFIEAIILSEIYE